MMSFVSNYSDFYILGERVHSIYIEIVLKILPATS